MSTEHIRARAASPPSLTAAEASAIGSHGFVGPRTPAWDAAERAAAPGGEAWAMSALREALARAWPESGADAAWLLEGRVPLPVLEAMKESAKSALSRDAASRPAATLVYFVAIAAALDRHGALITSMSREEVGVALVDLAEGLSPAWAAMLRRAALA